MDDQKTGMKKSPITEERIIETALALILSEGGIQGLNLRRIARELRCAHTNLYNYFPDMDSLLWRCVHEAGVRMMRSVRNKTVIGHAGESTSSILRRFCRFLSR
jgi:AcrR family transcriptional regulator